MYDSIVMVPTGQRIAHSPQRMHRVSSFNMAEPVMTPEFVGCHFVELHAEAFLVVTDVLHGLRLERDAVERNQLQTFLRANIDATAAQDAHAAVFRRAFENRIDPAVQAALRLGDRRRSVVADLHFRHPGAAFERKHRNGLAVDVEIVERHAVPLEYFDFDDGLGMLVLRAGIRRFRPRRVCRRPRCR